MSKQSELNSFISRLLVRLRLQAWLFGAAIFVGSRASTTIALVLVLNHYAFPSLGVKGGEARAGAALRSQRPLASFFH